MWFTPSACGPGHPELSKSYMDMARQLFTFTFTYVFPLPKFCDHALAVFTYKRYEVLRLFVRVCLQVFLCCSFIFPLCCECYIMLARSYHDGFQLVCTCHSAPHSRAWVPPLPQRGLCVTRRTQHRQGITSNDNTMHETSVRTNADLTKQNRTPTRYTLAKHTIILPIPTPRSCSKLTHTRRTYRHAPSQQVGDHAVPALTQRHNPSKLWTQRHEIFARSPPRAVSSQGQGHRCRSCGNQSV